MKEHHSQALDAVTLQVLEKITLFNAHVDSDLEARLVHFISELIMSGDVYTVEAPRGFKTENDYGKFDAQNSAKEFTLFASNLVAYEPMRMRRDFENHIKNIETELEVLENKLQKVKGIINV